MTLVHTAFVETRFIVGGNKKPRASFPRFACGGDRPRPCQNAKLPVFRVPLYPSRSAARPIQSILAGRFLHWPAPAHVFTQPRPRGDIRCDRAESLTNPLQRPATAHLFMSRSSRPSDLIVNLSLTAQRSDGSLKEVISGYHPIYQVRADYWSSAYHEFVGGTGVRTRQQCKAEVWLLSPEAYPHRF